MTKRETAGQIFLLTVAAFVLGALAYGIQQSAVAHNTDRIINCIAGILFCCFIGAGTIGNLSE